MGCYSLAIHPDTGEKIQFKAGNDFFEEYSVGELVPFTLREDRAGCGDFLDGAYDGWEEAGGNGHTHWVIIKDHRLHAIVPHKEGLMWPDVVETFGVQLDKSLWSDELWKEKEEKDAKDKAEFDAKYGHLPPEEQLGAATGELIVHAMNRPTLRDILKVEPIPDALVKAAEEGIANLDREAENAALRKALEKG